MDFTIDLSFVGWLLLILGAVVIGVVAQMIGEGAFRFEWVVTAVGAGIGALVASQFIVDMRAFEPVWEGLALIPALIGGVIVGAVVAVVTRYLARSSTPTATA